MSEGSDPSDRTLHLALHYSGLGYYVGPCGEGYGDAGASLQFEIPVSRGLEYIFLTSADRNCKALELSIEAEATGETIVKDTHLSANAVSGVRWNSEYTGTAIVVVRFVKVSTRCEWVAVVGRRIAGSLQFKGNDK